VVIIPILHGLYSNTIKGMSPVNAFVFTIFILCIVVMVAGIVLVLWPIVEEIVSPNRHIFTRLKTDLGYIKTQLQLMQF
jgi:hypothetical protein